MLYLFSKSTNCYIRLMLAVLIAGERVIVVSHGGFIRALYKWACPNGKPGKVLNTCVSVFHLYGEDKWTLKVWGDVSHLNETGFLESGFGGDRNSG